MAITVHEKWESRQSSDGENPSVDLRYIVQGTDDDLVAKSALTQASPVLYDGLVRQSTRLSALCALRQSVRGTVTHRARPTAYRWSSGGRRG